MRNLIDKYISFIYAFWLAPWLGRTARGIGMQRNKEITALLFGSISADCDIFLVQVFIFICFAVIFQRDRFPGPGQKAVNAVKLF